MTNESAPENADIHDGLTGLGTVEGSISTVWAKLSTAKRCSIVAAVRGTICDASDELIEACQSEQRIDDVETITAELMPLCAALSFLGRRGKKILRPRHCGIYGRPIWLWGSTARVTRIPLGNVLILGTWNYPLLLPGVQMAQALAAGNAVWIKPAPGTERATEIMVRAFYDAGVPRQQIRLLDSTVEAALEAIRQGPDLVVLTGAANTGRQVMVECGKQLTPTIMELSGCDAMVVLGDADVARVMECLRFGLYFNSGATCIAPRRLILMKHALPSMVKELTRTLGDLPTVHVHPRAVGGVADVLEEALEAGAKDLLGTIDLARLREQREMAPVVLSDVRPDMTTANTDLFAPVISVLTVDGPAHAAKVINQCRYRLAVSVFGSVRSANDFALSLDVGSVTINDLIVPTADPRAPFGGRGNSGFGVTRGHEGLLAMTTTRVIHTRLGSWLPHLRPRQPMDRPMLAGMLKMLYSRGFVRRFSGLRQIIDAVKNRNSTADEKNAPGG